MVECLGLYLMIKIRGRSIWDSVASDCRKNLCYLSVVYYLQHIQGTVQKGTRGSLNVYIGGA
jgi:hypothetical protein